MYLKQTTQFICLHVSCRSRLVHWIEVSLIAEDYFLRLKTLSNNKPQGKLTGFILNDLRLEQRQIY